MATSSAEPEKLFRYSDVTLHLDGEVKSESGRLRASLTHFESTCRDPAFRLSVSHHAGSLGSYGSECETIDSWVRRVGAGFQAADSAGLGSRSVLPSPAYLYTGPQLSNSSQQDSVFAEFVSIPAWLRDTLRSLWEHRSYLQPLTAGGLIASSIHFGSQYSGQIIINLPDFLRIFGISLRDIRSWAGLSPYLNHIRYSNIPTHFFKIGLLTSIPEIGYKWFKDSGKYQGTELASALTVDAVLTLAPVGISFLTSKGGAALGAEVGTLICPGVGTAVGGAAGAILGGVVGNVATRWAIEKTDFRETAIAWVDDQIMQPAATALASGVEAVDDAIQSTSDSIVSSMQGFSDWAWSSSRKVAEEVGL